MTALTLPSPLLPAPLDAALRPFAALYVVGGYVRDRLLGRATQDLDIAVAAEPRAAANRLGRDLGGHVFALSAEHGIWRVTLPAGIDGIRHIDVAALRGTIDADLRARDFTINALAATPDGATLIDPFAGRADLRDGMLRLVSAEAVRSDPLRALRAVRHTAELGFAVEPASAAIIKRDAPLLVGTAGERQRDELMRAFDTDAARGAIRLMDELGVLDVVLPELADARGCAQPREHYWDVFDHSVETVAVLDCLLGRVPVDAACRDRVGLLRQMWPDADTLDARWDEEVGEGRSRRALLKLVGLLHDVSKPETKSLEPDGRTRFFGHAERGAVRVAEALRRLRFSAREVKIAELLVREHLRPGQLAAPGEVPTLRSLYRFFRDLGECVPDLLLLNLADGAAAAGPRQRPEQWQAHVAYTAWILRQRRERETLVKRKRLVTGHDLMDELGLPPGPALGRLLDALAEAEATGEVTTREAALARARALVETGLM